MKKELIEELFTKFENACNNYEGIECWTTREIQSILGNTKWDNFVKVIDKAKFSCENVGEQIKYHFGDVWKMVEIGSSTKMKLIFLN